MKLYSNEHMICETRNGHIIAVMEPSRKAHARRLIAAYNAAEDAGISAEALEAGAVGRMVAIIKKRAVKLADRKRGAGINIPQEIELTEINAVLALIGKGEG